MLALSIRCISAFVLTDKFTGKERDSESGNDHFGAKYYASTMGRFLSPDWSAKIEPVPYSKLDDPQTLNLYDYVRNNPVSNVDADGHPCSGVLGNTGSGFLYKSDGAREIRCQSKHSIANAFLCCSECCFTGPCRSGCVELVVMC